MLPNSFEVWFEWFTITTRIWGRKHNRVFSLIKPKQAKYWLKQSPRIANIPFIQRKLRRRLNWKEMEKLEIRYGNWWNDFGSNSSQMFAQYCVNEFLYSSLLKKEKGWFSPSQLSPSFRWRFAIFRKCIVLSFHNVFKYLYILFPRNSLYGNLDIQLWGFELSFSF